MLNFPLIKDRFYQLSPTERQLLLSKLFGNARQGISYFSKVANPGLNKLEVLADFYGVPIDMLRTNCKFLFFPANITQEPGVKPKVRKKASKKADKEVDKCASRNKCLKEISGQLDEYWKKQYAASAESM